MMLCGSLFFLIIILEGGEDNKGESTSRVLEECCLFASLNYSIYKTTLEKMYGTVDIQKLSALR